MSEIKEKDMEVDSELKKTQKNLLVDLTHGLSPIVDRKKLIRRVAKNEKYGNKINDICFKSFKRHFELIVDELYNRNKNIESINENNSITNATIGQTIDNLIEKQKRIDKINETIVEKTLDLNDIKSEETRLEAVRRVVCPPNEICFDTIKDQLRQSPNDS